MMEKTEMSGAIVGESCGGGGGRGGGMWSRHTFSSACLEPTRTGVGSPGAKMESEVGVRTQEPEEGGDGEERVGQKRVRGGPNGDGEREARKMEVTARLGGEEGTIW